MPNPITYNPFSNRQIDPSVATRLGTTEQAVEIIGYIKRIAESAWPEYLIFDLVPADSPINGNELVRRAFNLPSTGWWEWIMFQYDLENTSSYNDVMYRVYADRPRAHGPFTSDPFMEWLGLTINPGKRAAVYFGGQISSGSLAIDANTTIYTGLSPLWVLPPSTKITPLAWDITSPGATNDVNVFYSKMIFRRVG